MKMNNFPSVDWSTLLCVGIPSSLLKSLRTYHRMKMLFFLVVIREKKLTFLLSPQANLRSGDLRLPFCLGDEKKKAPYRRLTTGRPDVLYVKYR